MALSRVLGSAGFVSAGFVSAGFVEAWSVTDWQARRFEGLLVDDPRANMQNNRLIALGAPSTDWSKTPGRALGFWITFAGFVLALVLPFWGVVAGLIGVAYSVRALRVMPAGVHGRGLILIALGLAAATVLIVVARGILGA